MLKNTDKNFGIMWSLIFVILTARYLDFSLIISILFLILSFLLLILALRFPKKLSLLNSYWIKLGNVFQKIISPLILSLIFILVLVPVGLVIKLMTKNYFLRYIESNKESYWIESENIINSTSMKNQF